MIANQFVFAQNQRAVERGLSYLARAQNADGSFGANKPVDQQIVVTSVSLLAFVSAGHAPDLGKFGSVVRGATDYLLRSIPNNRASAAHSSCAAALAEVAGIDDNPQDQTQFSHLFNNDANEPSMIPFTGNISATARTLLSLLSRSTFHQFNQTSYSTLYRADAFATRYHIDELRTLISSAVLARQSVDGSWENDPESTAYAVLALTAGDHLMPMAP